MTPAEQRFVDLYESYFVPVHAYCRRRTTLDRVDDAASEAFLVAWRRIDEIPEGSDALPWLYQAAFGVISNMWRGRDRQKKLKVKLQTIGIDHTPPADDFVIRRHQTSEILKALSRLTESDQEILRLLVWEELTHREVSLAIGASLDATRQRLSRAKKRLAREHERISDSTYDSGRKGGSP